MRYHIYKGSRNYEGRGYVGPSSDGYVMESDNIVYIVGWLDLLKQRNPGVAWVIRDTVTQDDIYTTKMSNAHRIAQ